MFVGQWIELIKSCVFLTLLLPVTVAEPQFLAIRNEEKLTLYCTHETVNCRHIDWLFTDRSVARKLFEKGEFVQHVDEYSQLKLTSSCSLEIMKMTEKLAGQFNCRWMGSTNDLATFFVAVVSLTRTKENHLSCSVTPPEVNRYKVRWLYNGNPYMNPEPWNGEKHIVTMFQENEEPLQEQLFSCEVKRDSTVVNLVPFNRHFKGDVATPPPTPPATPATTSRWSEDAAPSWWPFAVAASVVVALLCILVVVIICHRAKGKKTLPEENTNHLYDQIHQQHSLKPVEDECSVKERQQAVEPDEGISYASISYTKKRPKVTMCQVDEEEGGGDGVTYSTVKVSR